MAHKLLRNFPGKILRSAGVHSRLSTRNASTVVPVIDFADVYSNPDIASAPQVEQFRSAFTDIGFAYIRNHGIDPHLIQAANKVALKFFHQPEDIKAKYLYRIGENHTGHNGYTKLGQERDTPDSPCMMEAFDSCCLNNPIYPDDEMPEFREIFTKFYREGRRVGYKILEMLGHVLELEDPNYFLRLHSKVGEGYEQNYSQIRVLYYPPVPSIQWSSLPEYRIKEHTDYGTFTLLLADKNGGLEIKQRNGQWYRVPPTQEDYLLLNLGKFFTYWTADRLRATPHRVFRPTDEASKNRHRLSMGIFFHPDAETVVKPLDGCDAYPPFVAGESTKQIYKNTIYDTSYED